MRALQVAVLTTLWLGCAPWASAQVRATSIETLTARPSQEGASQQLGGNYTRAQVLNTAQRSNTPLLGQSSLDFFNIPRRQAPRSLPVAQVGLSSPLTGAGGYPLSVGINGADAATISGLIAAQSLNVPVPGRYGLPSISAFRYGPPSQSTRFERLVGLKPVDTTTISDLRIQDVPTALAQAMRARIDQSATEALALFKDATRLQPVLDPASNVLRYEDCAVCEERLAAWNTRSAGDSSYTPPENCDSACRRLIDMADQALRRVRTSASDNDVACLLLAHLALDQERPLLAGIYLADAYARNPQLFSADPAALATYFGDFQDGRSRHLESQMDRYVQVGSMNPNSAEAQLLTAYCAWRRGEAARALEAVTVAEGLVTKQAGEASNRMVTLTMGMSQALQVGH